MSAKKPKFGIGTEAQEKLCKNSHSQALSQISTSGSNSAYTQIMDYSRDEQAVKGGPSSHSHLNQLNSHQDDNLTDKPGFKLFMSEFLGTFIFVYLAQSSLTSFELIGTQNDIINRQLATIFTCGLAYLIAALLTINLSGAHLNPAFTVASAFFGRLKWGRAFNYIAAQYIGSFVAAIFLHATYSDKIAQRHIEGLLNGKNSTLKSHGNILSTGKLFSSYPPTEVSVTQLFTSYTLATAHLMLILLSVQESKLFRMPRCIKPVYMAAALILIQAAFSANGGPVLNPAQDFSPRVYIAMFGWGSSAFNLYRYNYWWICGLLAPHFGALVGFGVYRILSHLNTIQDRSDDDCAEREYNLTRDLDF